MHESWQLNYYTTLLRHTLPRRLRPRRACGTVSSVPAMPVYTCLRTDEESLGPRRTDEESLGFSKDRRAIGRDMPLGGNGLHRLSGTSRPRGLRPPSRGQSGRRGRRATPGRGCWTGHGLAGGRGQARRREGHPPWQPGGRGAGGHSRPLDGAWLLPGQGQPPRRPCGHRRLPGPQEPSGIAVLAGRAPRASGRQRLAGVE